MAKIKQCLGFALFTAAPIAEDQERNTDLIVLNMASVRIACRVRCAEIAAPDFCDWCSKPHSVDAWPRFADEFTIRASRPTGTKTEMAKIHDGWGDYFFYGLGDRNRKFVRWTLARLDVFRRVDPVGHTQQNRDGSSSFRVFRWNDLPPEFIVKSYDLRLTSAANDAAISHSATAQPSPEQRRGWRDEQRDPSVKLIP
ncbi:MAG TPA: hypothetical protein VMV27_07675 [Candidatus Binataceae bacterium]|nr:hypothetical protein [Candidatus Binataceae bacterium]